MSSTEKGSYSVRGHDFPFTLEHKPEHQQCPRGLVRHSFVNGVSSFFDGVDNNQAFIRSLILSIHG